jgi:hypothetical protein
MSDLQRHAQFLRQCIRYDESATRQELEEGITRVQRDARCVRRAVWLRWLTRLPSKPGWPGKGVPAAKPNPEVAGNFCFQISGFQFSKH